MSVPVRLRHPLVVLGVVLSLLAGAATIRAAASWTAASSPLTVKPPSVERLQADLAAEQARSADLQLQLDQLAASSRDLVTALETARVRIATDAEQAAALQDSLAAAKEKLATLEQTIRQARAAAVAAVAPAPPTAATAATSTLVAAREGGDEPHDGGKEWGDDD
jgi:DNA repair exonuclease SbcCD ATPase subunit